MTPQSFISFVLGARPSVRHERTEMDGAPHRMLWKLREGVADTE